MILFNVDLAGWLLFQCQLDEVAYNRFLRVESVKCAKMSGSCHARIRSTDSCADFFIVRKAATTAGPSLLAGWRRSCSGGGRC